MHSLLHGTMYHVVYVSAWLSSYALTPIVQITGCAHKGACALRKELAWACGCSDNLRLQSMSRVHSGLVWQHVICPPTESRHTNEVASHSLHIRAFSPHQKHSPFHRKGSKETLLRSRPYQSWACRRTTGEQSILHRSHVTCMHRHTGHTTVLTRAGRFSLRCLMRQSALHCG
jgi:hypothetical protein